MFDIERLLKVTYYIRRGGETIWSSAQAAADKTLQGPDEAHTANIDGGKSMRRFWVDRSWSVKDKREKVYTAYGMLNAM